MNRYFQASYSLGTVLNVVQMWTLSTLVSVRDSAVTVVYTSISQMKQLRPGKVTSWGCTVYGQHPDNSFSRTARERNPWSPSLLRLLPSYSAWGRTEWKVRMPTTSHSSSVKATWKKSPTFYKKKPCHVSIYQTLNSRVLNALLIKETVNAFASRG